MHPGLRDHVHSEGLLVTWQVPLRGTWITYLGARWGPLSVETSGVHRLLSYLLFSVRLDMLVQIRRLQKLLRAVPAQEYTVAFVPSLVVVVSDPGRKRIFTVSKITLKGLFASSVAPHVGDEVSFFSECLLTVLLRAYERSFSSLKCKIRTNG